MREFDLNIERVLENWAVAHALREVIANALDEQALTGTAEPQILPTPRTAGTSGTGAAGSATSAIAIRGRHGDITAGEQTKQSFADIKTLHALITEPAEPYFTGIEFILLRIGVSVERGVF